MKSLHFQGKPLSDDLSRACVLFDPKDGRIVHIHGVTTVRKERACTNDQLEERLVRHAQAFGHSVAGLKILHVPLSAVQQQGFLKVDEKGASVIASARPSRRELRAKR
jgi:hypothetical protein